MAAPRIFINLPVYNGAPSLRRQLDSIFSQTCGDFKLFVSDNGSTDETPDICRESLGDRRFEYSRYPANLGIGMNFNCGFFRGLDHEFIIYASHNDYWQPNYLKACLGGLDLSSKAVLAYSHCRLLRSDGDRVCRDDFDLNGLDPVDRFLTLMRQIDVCTAFYGLLRTEAVIKNAQYLHNPSAGNDNLFLAAMALSGPFVQVPETLFTREFPAHAYQGLVARRVLIEQMNNKRDYFPSFPFLEHLLSSLGIILSFPDLAPKDKNRAYAEVVNISLIRSRHMLEEEISLVLNNMLQGRLHTGFSGKTAFTANEFKLLDFFVAISVLRALESARFFLVPPPPGLDLGRALCLIILGRIREAKAAVDLELKLAQSSFYPQALRLSAQLAATLAGSQAAGE